MLDSEHGCFGLHGHAADRVSRSGIDLHVCCPVGVDSSMGASTVVYFSFTMHRSTADFSVMISWCSRRSFARAETGDSTSLCPAYG